MPEQANSASDSVAATPDLMARVSNMIEKAQNFEPDLDISGEEMERWLSGRVAPLFKELRDELEGMRKNRDNLREYLAERTAERDAARVAFAGANASAERARSILRAVMAEATRAPAWIGEAVEIPPGKRDAQQAAGVALWQVQCTAQAIRFVAELATMTDNECDFLDGHEMRGIARLLQVPDDEGSRAPTVPRLYSDEDRTRAKAAISWISTAQSGCFDLAEVVDEVAEALGMRRAGA